MSFADVGRAGRQRRAAPSSASGAFSAAAAGGGAARSRGGGGNNNNAAPSSTLQPGGGYEQVSDSIVQYQRNVALLEKLARSAGTQNDTSVLQTQYSVQIDVINQLGQRIESQFKAQEQRISSLPRTEAGQLRTTHVKLSRDYRQVEQQFKNVQLDVKRKRSLAEAKQRELAMEEEQKERRRREKSGEDITEEALKWQMQIQEDKISEEIMREREEEIRNIHKGMHTVNEIYKDLAHLVDNQQAGVDQIETQMENTKDNTATGLKHIEKANESDKSQCRIS